ERAARQNANCDDAGAGFRRVLEKAAVVLPGIVRRQRFRRGWIEHVVDDLRAVEGAGIDDLLQRPRVADRGEAEKPRLALLAQFLESGHHLAEPLRDAERGTAAGVSDRIVQVKDIDVVPAQAFEAVLERLRDRIANASGIAWRQPDLGANHDIGRLERLQDAAEVLFGFAVAVLHGRVEVVDAGGERPRDRALLVGRRAAHHEPAHGAAAEAEQGQLHSGAPEYARLHR